MKRKLNHSTLKASHHAPSLLINTKQTLFYIQQFTTHAPLTIHNASISAPPVQRDEILTLSTPCVVFCEELLSVISEIARDMSCAFQMGTPDCKTAQTWLHWYLIALFMTKGEPSGKCEQFKCVRGIKQHLQKFISPYFPTEYFYDKNDKTMYQKTI